MKLYRFLFQTLDPVHVGVGGYRLGRVDLPIAREPGTGLPKIPGTGLSGAARHYAALRARKMECAGQGEGAVRGHCGNVDTCPICHTFGTLRSSKDGETVAVAGRVRIFDARVLLFPVATFQGPVWTTSPQTLRDFGLEDVCEPAQDKVYLSEFLLNRLGGKDESQGSSFLNLGWLMVEVGGKYDLLRSQRGSSNASKDTEVKGKNEKEVAEGLWSELREYVRNRVVLVSDDLFSTVVNSNLEVRTSVSIDPETGAAKEGALFTYEALPRSTFLFLDVVVEDRIRANGQDDEGPFKDGWPKKNSQEVGGGGVPPGSWKSPIDVVKAGFEYFAILGVGGMATRGFGRIRQVGYREVILNGKS